MKKSYIEIETTLKKLFFRFNYIVFQWIFEYNQLNYNKNSNKKEELLFSATGVLKVICCNKKKSNESWKWKDKQNKTKKKDNFTLFAIS